MNITLKDLALILLTVIAIVFLTVVFVVEPQKIKGASMEPTLEENDLVLTEKLSKRFHTLKVGDVIVFTKSNKTYVKRISLKDNNFYYVLGDNKAISVDSRTFGFVEEKEIIGRVMFRYYPIHKMGGLKSR